MNSSGLDKLRIYNPIAYLQFTVVANALDYTFKKRHASSEAKDTQIYSLYYFKEVSRDCLSVTYKLLMFLIKNHCIPRKQKDIRAHVYR